MQTTQQSRGVIIEPPPIDDPITKHLTASEIVNRAIDYFNWCSAKGVPPTIRGLAIRAWQVHPDIVLQIEAGQYRRVDDQRGVTRAISWAKQVVYEWLDTQLASGKASSSLVFYTKQVLGYRDTQAIDITNNVQIAISHKAPLEIYQELGLQEGAKAIEVVPEDDQGGRPENLDGI